MVVFGLLNPRRGEGLTNLRVALFDVGIIPAVVGDVGESTARVEDVGIMAVVFEKKISS